MEVFIVANKEQKKVQKAPPKSNKQKKELQREKKSSQIWQLSEERVTVVNNECVSALDTLVTIRVKSV